MRLLCYSGLRSLLRRSKREDTLSPLLRVVKPQTPPEGLLKNIERAMDGCAPEASKQGWGWSARTLVAGATLGIAGMVLFLALPAQRVQLVDQSGHALVYLQQQGNITLAQMAIAPLSDDVPMRWRLWGLDASGKGPTYLGAFGPTGIVVERPDEFSSFAMSLEQNSFSGSQPVGPVIVLEKENNSESAASKFGSVPFVW